MALAGLALLAGCRLHMARVEEGPRISPDDYRAIAVGEEGRAQVLARLGPPDRITYTLTHEVGEYNSAHHRATDLRFIVPTAVFGTPGLGIVLGILDFLFAPFEEPEEFHEPLAVLFSKLAVGVLSGFAPFTGGNDPLMLRGRQLREDRIYVVFDRETLRVTAKALQLATGEFEHESIFQRALLRTN